MIYCASSYPNLKNLQQQKSVTFLLKTLKPSSNRFYGSGLSTLTIEKIHQSNNNSCQNDLNAVQSYCITKVTSVMPGS